MGKRVYLSYLLDEDSVVWPGEPTVRIEQDTSIRQNGYNSFKTTLPNHHGTHMDGPAHFNPDGPRLLIIRDSYADSLVPFLTPHFSEIHLLDLRYYKLSIADYIAQNGIDQALVLYSVPNFVTDSNLLWIAK